MTLPVFERQLSTALGLSNAQEEGPTEKRWLSVAPIKGKERMGEKVREYADEVVGDNDIHTTWPHASQVVIYSLDSSCGTITNACISSQIGDTLRAMVVCKDGESSKQTWDQLNTNFNVVRLRN